MFSSNLHIVQSFSKANHLFSIVTSSLKRCVYLIMYIDDIVIIENDAAKISKLKEHIQSFSGQVSSKS